MESAEFKDGLTKENKSIFERIAGILEKKSVPDKELNIIYGTLHNILNPDLMVDMGVAYDKTATDTATEDFTSIPQGLQFPICFFKDWRQQEETMIMTTPYGPLSSFAIGEDGWPYMFVNIYFFSQNGQAKKFEQIVRAGLDNQSLEEAFSWLGWDRDRTARLNFTPKEEDSRYVDLKREDYDKINKILKQIESGEYIQVIT